MKFTEEKIEAINNRVNQLKENYHMDAGLKINIDSCCGKTNVYKSNWGLCELDELAQLIKELTLLKTAVELETGLVL